MNDLQTKPKAPQPPNIFLTLLLISGGVVLIIFGLMKGDPGRFLGGDTPILTVFQVILGGYLLYCVWQYWNKK